MNIHIYDIIDAHQRCNPHAVDEHVRRLSRKLKSFYKSIRIQNADIHTCRKNYSAVCAADEHIQNIYFLLTPEKIREYELYRDATRQFILKRMDTWIDNIFYSNPFST